MEWLQIKTPPFGIGCHLLQTMASASLIVIQSSRTLKIAYEYNAGMTNDDDSGNEKRTKEQKLLDARFGHIVVDPNKPPSASYPPPYPKDKKPSQTSSDGYEGSPKPVLTIDGGTIQTASQIADGMGHTPR